jgi:glycyl-radical enzyme activating protein
MTGIVFDIQRFSLHDGPGIRTTVFLKGCPLQCLWCHNPESMALRPQLSYNQERCVSCPACVEALRHGIHGLQSSTLAIDLDDTGACVDACPHGAFSVIGRRMTVEEVIAEVRRDEPYFKKSGGGLTISGGEPLAQFEFTVALLQSAKQGGLNVCLDTSGAVSRKKISEVARLVDLFLYDYKATDPVVHREVTGASNYLVVGNLDYLYRTGARIHLRCPMIPGINDSPDHLAAIAQLERTYPGLVAIELMPYHDLGREKAMRIGQSFPLADLPSANKDVQQRWLDALQGLGCRRVYIA